MRSNKLTIISDIHGNYYKYFKICEESEFTLQLGDTGYSNSIIANNLDPKNHKFFTGNHNDHEKDYELPHCLGRYGFTEHGGVCFFFVSGAFSIDWEIRKKRYYSGEWPKTWFENEELSIQEMEACQKLYEETKPDILITHEAPRCTVKDFTNSEILKNFGYDPKTFTTRTSDFLDSLWAIHKPFVHVCGHYHKRYNNRYGNTQFMVLEELGTLEL